MAIAVFEGERSGVECQRVELQRAGNGVALDRKAGLLAASPRAVFRLSADVTAIVVLLLL